MKKTIYLILLLPLLCFSQNTKTNQVVDQANAAVNVANNVIGLFKKNKNKDKTETPKTDDKTSKNNNSDGSFPEKARPEDIVRSIYKCSYKNIGDKNYCVWKPTPQDFGKMKQNSNGTWTDMDPNLILATEVDTVMTFQQNGTNKMVIATASHELNENGGIADYHAAGAYTGFIQMQITEEKTLMPISIDKLMLYSGSFGNSGEVGLLKIDDNNMFYEVTDSQMHQGVSDTGYSYYDFSGKSVLGYWDSDNGGFDPDNYDTSETKMEIDKINKLIKLVTVNQHYTKGKLIKSSKETVGNYQYNNGTITKIEQPLTTKPAAKTSAKKK
ncbi:MAG: hypothetical protein L6262_02410 [Weeksellaceae bacterium]|nr:hypothetical protein [Weeksellaceae bacterium]